MTVVSRHHEGGIADHIALENLVVVRVIDHRRQLPRDLNQGEKRQQICQALRDSVTLEAQLALQHIGKLLEPVSR